MQKFSYAHHRFPPEIIQYAVWLYFRFPLNFRDIEDLLAERGIDVTYETVRRWCLKFGRAYAASLRRYQPHTDTCWHLDEVFISINGRRLYLWRAVDAEGVVLDVLAQSRRNTKAAMKLMRKLLKRQGISPDAIVTDKLPSYGAALGDLGMKGRHVTGGRSNNRAENSHQPFRRREWAMLRFRQMRSLQKFAAIHSSVHNHFNLERHLNNRSNFKQNRAVALAERCHLGVA